MESQALWRAESLFWSKVVEQKLYMDSEGVPFCSITTNLPVSVKDQSGIVPEKASRLLRNGL